MQNFVKHEMSLVAYPGLLTVTTPSHLQEEGEPVREICVSIDVGVCIYSVYGVTVILSRSRSSRRWSRLASSTTALSGTTCAAEGADPEGYSKQYTMVLGPIRNTMECHISLVVLPLVAVRRASFREPSGMRTGPSSVQPRVEGTWWAILVASALRASWPSVAWTGFHWMNEPKLPWVGRWGPQKNWL